MMLCPEAFYCAVLQDKPASEILNIIHSLKREIRKFKREIEHVSLKAGTLVFPSTHTEIKYRRQYLEQAVIAYKEAGGTYVPDSAERRAEQLEAAIPDIVSISFETGSFHKGFNTRTVSFSNEEVYLLTSRSANNDSQKKICKTTKSTFLNLFKNVYVSEWKKSYSNPDVLDGEQWELTISYASGRKITYTGSNSYPFSFYELCELFEDIERNV